jgi:hypothetical protein
MLRFLADSDKYSRTTGTNINLIQKFKIVLEVISNDHSINVEKFEEYTINTAKPYA